MQLLKERMESRGSVEHRFNILRAGNEATGIRKAIQKG